MTTRKNTYIFYIFLITLISSGLFLFLEKSGIVKDGIRIFSNDTIPNDKLCELLQQNENKRAEYFFDKGYEERQTGSEEPYQIEYSIDNWESSIVFNTEVDRKNKIFWLYFSHSKKDLYLNVIKGVGKNSILLPQDTVKNDGIQRYKLSEVCFVKDVGFFRSRKEYVIVVTDTYF